jgi:predicted O-methyltransferase YrrM
MGLDRLNADGNALGDYIDRLVLPEQPIATLYQENADDEWAMMMTHPDLGRLLAVLVTATGGRRVLEIGTFVGVSATWMAQALAPGGHLDTLELDEGRVERARAWFSRVGLDGRVSVHQGPALQTLAGLPAGAYDLAYVDADKTGYLDYLEQCLRLVRTGGLIVADNVLAGGALGQDPSADDERVAALREFTRRTMEHPRLRTSLVTVGDGITLSVVLP